MKIDYDWGREPKAKTCAVARMFRRLTSRRPTPLHMSNHYVRDHFHPEDESQGKLF